jgi:hypothetical protein
MHLQQIHRSDLGEIKNGFLCGLRIGSWLLMNSLREQREELKLRHGLAYKILRRTS